jgi:hypothetical protein
MRTMIILATATALAGCAGKGLYQWGGYDEHLYAAYKEPAKAVVLRQKLQEQVQASEKAGQKVAPGLYAEIGTLYLQAGERQQALGWYQKEQQAWPESRTLMGALIQNLQRLEPASRTPNPQEAAQ